MKSIEDLLSGKLNIIYYPLIEMAASMRRKLLDQCNEFTGTLIRYDIGEQLENNIYVNIRKRKT